AGAPTQLLGVDASGNVKTTVPSAIVTTYGWGITGNTGTTPSTNFIGNSDDVALVFKVKNDFSGQISNSNSANTAGNMNTAFGYKAAAQSSAGYGNSAFGYRAMNATTTGTSNTAMGIYAMNTNTTGSSNTAVGTYTLMNNNFNPSIPTQKGDGNTAVGANSLYNNTYGSNNSGFGSRSMNRNTTGMNNTALGYSAMNNNTTGFNNTSVGVNSMYNLSLSVSTTGRDNSTLGFSAMTNTSSGSFNTAMGSGALATNTTGDYNTAIGTNADVSAANLTKATAIGYNAVVGASNSMVLGGTGADVVSVGINTTTPTSRLYVNGSFGTAIRTTAASTTLDETDHTLIITGTASTGTVTLTIPAAAAGNKGRIYRVVNQTGNTQATSVNFQDFTGTASSTVPTGKLVIQSDGANWYQID
ncbi:MAG: hypothetical protein JST27_02405, partial [Bacteroidetes bacterium]|nr:hypothetical protein [Bacteroidota bacterium]